MNLRHGIPEEQYFCFHLFLFEYVVSLDKAFMLCDYFYNYCIVFNSLVIFVVKFCFPTEESTVYKLSHLFYSILFYSILFYSILFYSILFYQKPITT